MKIDSKCMSLATKADPFLSLERMRKSQHLGYSQDFWKDLSQSPEDTSSFLVCLIVRLVSLDSGHGLRSLPEVYRDFAEMDPSQSKYKSWVNQEKALSSPFKAAAMELQHAIISTIHFVKEFYTYCSGIHLRHAFIIWNLARNSSDSPSGRKLASRFEEELVSPFAVADNKQLMHNIKTVSTSEQEEKLVCTLIEKCYMDHCRASFGTFPPEECELCNFRSVSDSLMYIKLKELVSKSPTLLKVAVTQVLSLLKKEASSSQDYGEREVLFPLLHLFKEFLAMSCEMDMVDAYKTILHFYTWPLPHAESAMKTLDMLNMESKSKGNTFRRRLLLEHDMSLRVMGSRLRTQTMHILLDYSLSNAKAAEFYEIFSNKQDVPPQRSLLKLLLRNVFKSIFPGFDVLTFEAKLKLLQTPTLLSFSSEVMEKMEVAAGMSSDKDVKAFLDQELNQLHGRIIHYSDPNEQRDSAVSCGSVDGDSQQEDLLSSFPLPAPHLPCTPLDNAAYSTVHSKLKSLLLQFQEADAPRVPPTPPTPIVDTTKFSLEHQQQQRTAHGQQPFPLTTVPLLPPPLLPPPSSSSSYVSRTFSDSSTTTIDSTGSSTAMAEDAAAMAAATCTTAATGGLLQLTNGHTNGHTHHNRSNGVNHMGGGGVSPGRLDPDYPPSLMEVSLPDGGGAANSTTSSCSESGSRPMSGDLSSLTSSTSTNDMLDDSRTPSPSEFSDSFHTFPEEEEGRVLSQESTSTNNTNNNCSQSVNNGSSLGSLDELSMEMEGGGSDSISEERQVMLAGKRSRAKALLVKRPTVISGLGEGIVGSTCTFSGTINVIGGNRSGSMSQKYNTSSPLSNQMMGTLRVKNRKPTQSLSVKHRQGRQGLTSGVFSPVKKVNKKIVKIILAGNDTLVSNAAQAYSALLMDEPSLFSGLEVFFYYIPLSQASSSYYNVSPPSSSSSSSSSASASSSSTASVLPEPSQERFNGSGNDIYIGRYLAHLDSWYEQNVMLAVHNSLHLLPPDQYASVMHRFTMSGSVAESESSGGRPPPSPSKVLLDLVSNYCCEASHPIRFKMFKLKMSTKNEKTHKISRRNLKYMLQRIEIFRLSGKKANRQAKPFDVNLQKTELALDGSFLRSEQMEMKGLWAIRGHNIPRPQDTLVSNPEMEGLEVTMTKALAEGGKISSTKYRLLEETQHHVYELTLETRDKPFSVMVDGDAENIIENVIKLELSPVYTDQTYTFTASPTHQADRQERQLYFPIMTYWPADL